MGIAKKSTAAAAAPAITTTSSSFFLCLLTNEFGKAKQAAASSNIAVVCPFCQIRRSSVFFVLWLGFHRVGLEAGGGGGQQLPPDLHGGQLLLCHPVPGCDRAIEWTVYKQLEMDNSKSWNVYRVILPERPKHGLEVDGDHRHGVQELRRVHKRRPTTVRHPDPSQSKRKVPFSISRFSSHVYGNFNKVAAPNSSRIFQIHLKFQEMKHLLII